MRLIVIFLLSASIAGAQNIGTRVLTPGTSIRIELSPAIATTLLFPGPISGTFGTGLVSNGQNQQGLVQIEHPEGSAVLVLHALSETAHVIMTILFDSSLYVFHLESGPHPDAAITLTKIDQSADGGKQVTAEDVKAARPKYDPELLVGFETKARDAALLRKLYPDLYQGYASRQAYYTSDSGTVKTTVTQIHRFSVRMPSFWRERFKTKPIIESSLTGALPLSRSQTRSIRRSSPIAFDQSQPAQQSQSLS